MDPPHHTRYQAEVEVVGFYERFSIGKGQDKRLLWETRLMVLFESGQKLVKRRTKWMDPKGHYVEKWNIFSLENLCFIHSEVLIDQPSYLGYFNI